MNPPARPVPAVALVLAVATLLAYARAPDCAFIKLDDGGYVVENDQVRGGLTLAHLRWAFTTFEQGNWHPLTWLSLQLDYNLYGGLKAGGYHFTNVVLHVANTVLLFLVWWRMTGAIWRSAFVAALFALHPLHVESVAWVAERKDVLSTLFWLLTIGAYISYVKRPGPMRYGLVLLAFSLGLLAKPMLVTLPCVLLLLDYWPLSRTRVTGLVRADEPPGGDTPRRSPWAFVIEKLPLFALAAISCIVTVRAQAFGGAIGSLEHYPLSARLLNSLSAYVAYLGKTAWPARLAFFYPHPETALSTTHALAAGALLLVITVGVAIAARRRPYLLMGWLWYLGTLVPVIGLVQVGSQALADRYTYVPLIGIFVALAWGCGDLVEAAERRWLRVSVAAVALALLAACSLRTVQQLATWRDNVSVAEQAVAATPDNFFAHAYLGHAYLDAGQPKKAWRHYTRAMQLRPVDASVLNGFGLACFRLGDLAEAEKAFQAALALEPDMTQVYHNLAHAYALDPTQRPEAALEASRQAVQRNDRDAEAWCLLAHQSLLAGRAEEAMRHYHTALNLAPNVPDLLNERAARLLATPPTAWQAVQALLFAQQACEATRGRRADFLETLAAAEAGSGRYAEAVQILRRALTLLADRPDPARHRALEDRLGAYEQARHANR